MANTRLAVTPQQQFIEHITRVATDRTTSGPARRPSMARWSKYRLARFSDERNPGGAIPFTAKSKQAAGEWRWWTPIHSWIFSDAAAIILASCSNDFKILRYDGCRTISGHIMLLIEALQIPPQSSWPIIVECSESPAGRPEIDPVELDRVRNGKWEHQRGRLPSASNVGHICVQSFANRHLIAPLQRAGRPSGGGDMLAGHPKKIANEAGRRPIRHHDPPARTANPGKLPRNNLGAGREHR